MLKRIASIVFALLVMGHGLIHLGIIPGGPQGADGKTGWSGKSAMLSHLLSPSIIWAIAVFLIAGLLLFYIVGGLGLLGIPVLKHLWKAAIIVASILSLLLFAITWEGILPHPSDAIWGPIISGVLLVGLLLVPTLFRPKSLATEGYKSMP